MVGSEWNAELLKERGLKIKVWTILQGVDPHLFFPPPRLSTPPAPTYERSPRHGGSVSSARRRILGVDILHDTSLDTDILHDPAHDTLHDISTKQARQASAGAGGGVRRPAQLQGRFVVFSGGKFELRKAQDIVVGALRALIKNWDVTNARHRGEGGRRPLLLYAWHNAWDIRWFAEGGGPGHTVGVPQRRRRRNGAGGTRRPPGAGQEGGDEGDQDAYGTEDTYGAVQDEIYDFESWLEANGIGRGDAVNLGHIAPHELAVVLREWVDAALFPNRCEGGTNLVAMETLASGVPVVLSANTGHKDLISRICTQYQPLQAGGGAWDRKFVDGCIPLRKQRTIVSAGGGGGVGGNNPYVGWGESDVNEAALALMSIASNTSFAALLGRTGAERMKSLTWSRTRRLLSDALVAFSQAKP